MMIVMVTELLNMESTAMKGMCFRVCIVIHALCGVAYTSAGSILMVAGTFFFISSPPLLQLGSNMLTGGLCIVFGVGSVIITCCGGRDMTVSRLHKLLACTLTVLSVSVINIVILEVGEWWWLYNEETIAFHQMEQLAYYGRLVPSLTTCVVIAVAFLDAQFLYCTLGLQKRERMPHSRVNETVSDIEYILPREKAMSSSSKQVHSLTQYTQSWVFDTDTGSTSQTESPYSKLPGARSADLPRRYQPPSPIVTVQVESSCEEGPEVDRQLNHMRSFSRAQSPGADEGPTSSTSHLPIYECLEKLTQPTVYRNRLDAYIQDNDSDPKRLSGSCCDQNRSGRESIETNPYASLIAELGRSLVLKNETRDNDTLSPSTANEVNPVELRSRGSDAEFSKELEAALKLIQDLESPNTIETPSETFHAITDVKHRHQSLGSSGSSKTLSGSSSYDEHGKLCSRLLVESESTSGYNSPSNSDRYTPVPSGGSMGCIIRQVGSAAVISIIPSGSQLPLDSRSLPSADARSTFSVDSKAHSTGDANSKSADRRFKMALARMKKLIAAKRPPMLPDLDRAVLKSESLAFLTDCELENRLLETRSVLRRIEAKVRQDMYFRRCESYGSIEDMMDNEVTQF